MLSTLDVRTLGALRPRRTRSGEYAVSEVARFREIRDDGKVIDESMSVAEILSRGWNPATVVAVEWECAGRAVSLRSTSGLLARVVPGRRFVAVIEHDIGRSELRVLNADGTLRAELPNVQTIRGRPEGGSFLWFEPSRTQPVDAFGVVFRTGGNEDFCIDFDARTGAVAGVHEAR